MRRRTALWVYALLMLGALGWALYEVGTDWWQLAPRGSIIAPLGLWLLTPWIARRPAGSISASVPVVQRFR